MHNIFDLKEMDVEQLRSLGQELEVKGFKKMQKEDLIYAILDKEAEKNAKMDEVATKIADALSEYMIMMGFETEESLTGAEVREMLDEFMPLFNKLKNFKVKIETIPSSHAEDVISKWLRNMNW